MYLLNPIMNKECFPSLINRLFSDPRLSESQFCQLFLRTFLCNYYLVLSKCELLSIKLKSKESLPTKERITKKRYQTRPYKICTIKIQVVSVKVTFSPSMSQGLNLIKYW